MKRLFESIGIRLAREPAFVVAASYRLGTALCDLASRLERSRRARQFFVGRARELDELKHRFDEVVEG